MGPGPSDDDFGLHPGGHLGPYELLARVGAGGMAHVWAARHRLTNDIFALKMLLPHLTENDSFRQMFFDEARIASRIQHENVCATYELIELEGILMLVMEWVDGSSLVRMLRPGAEDREDLPRIPLPIRHAVRILAETCAGLHAAHDLVDEHGTPLNVVHRDVSPHNVLLTLDGRVKVTDFGVAKALGKLHKTIAGQVKGKLAYMSPEQLVGGGVDRRSDVFSLGSVLYEACTGLKPFQGEHDPQIMSAIIMGHFEPPRAVMPSFPAALEEIVLRAMATEPDHRYATALQFKQALDGWLARSGPPVGAQQVAVLLHERCGPELDRRARALSLPPPPPMPVMHMDSGNGAMEVERRAYPSSGGRRSDFSVLWAALAVVIGLGAGLGVLFYVRAARRARAVHAAALHADAAAPAPMTAAPTVSSVTVLPLDAGILDIDDLDTPPPTAVAPVTPGGVTLRIPEGARILIDNKELPPGVLVIPRPEAGVTTVIVRAEGRNDAFVFVDGKTPDVYEVKMSRKKKPIVDAGAPPAPAGSDSTPPTPPNPYD